MLFLDNVSINKADSTLHHIFQLADIAGPVVAAQAFQDWKRNTVHRFAKPRRNAGYKIVDQQCDVPDSLRKDGM